MFKKHQISTGQLLADSSSTETLNCLKPVEEPIKFADFQKNIAVFLLIIIVQYSILVADPSSILNARHIWTQLNGLALHEFS